MAAKTDLIRARRCGVEEKEKGESVGLGLEFSSLSSPLLSSCPLGGRRNQRTPASGMESHALGTLPGETGLVNQVFALLLDLSCLQFVPVCRYPGRTVYGSVDY
jgi:hypothetical protein